MSLSKKQTTLDFAEYSGISHKSILRKIKSLPDSLIGTFYIEGYYLTKDNKEKPLYTMKDWGWFYLSVSFTGEKGDILRVVTVNRLVELIDFIDNGRGYAMVEAMSSLATSSEIDVEEVEPIIYILSNGTHYKIGKTTSKVGVKTRIKQLQTGSSLKIIEVFSIETERANEIECYLHRYYKDSRISGEWFKLSPSELEDAIQIACGNLSINTGVFNG